MLQAVKIVEEIRVKKLIEGHWVEINTRPNIEEQVEQILQNGGKIIHTSPPGFEILERTPEQITLLTGLVITYERQEIESKNEVQPVVEQPKLDADGGDNYGNNVVLGPFDTFF